MKPTVEMSETAGSLSEALIRKHEGVLRSRVWRLFERLGRPPGRELVEEIVQEAYCRLLEDALPRRRGRTVGELLSFLGTIAERAVLDHLRSVQAGKRDRSREVSLGRRIEQIPDPAGDPERDLLRAETERLLVRHCRDTSRDTSWERGRRNAWVARLALLEGWSNQEIASAAGGRLSPAMVACLVHRFRRRLERDGFAPARRGRRRTAGVSSPP